MGFWLGIFAIHKTWTSLAFWWRIDDKTGTLAYPVWCIVWVVRTQFFAENSNRGRKVSPEKLKSSHSRRFLLEKSKNSKSRKVEKFENFEKSKSSDSRRFLLEKFEKCEKSKSSHSRRFLLEKSKTFHFLTFCEKFCNFRAVRLPARRALSYDGTPILKRKPVWEDCGNSLLKFTPFWKSIYRKERHIRETKTRTVAHKELSKGNSKKAGNKRGSSVWLGNYTMDTMGICMYLQHLGVETWQPSAQYPTTNPPPKKKHKTHIAQIMHANGHVKCV